MGQSSFITSDLGLLQHFTAVLLPQRQFSQSACWSLLVSFCFWTTTFPLVQSFCSGCDHTHWSSLLNSLKLIGGVRFSFYVYVLEGITLTLTDCRPCPALQCQTFHYMCLMFSLGLYLNTLLACETKVDSFFNQYILIVHFFE